MSGTIIEISTNARSRRRLRHSGLVLIGIGLTGIILPQVISITLSLLVGGLLLAAAALTGYAAWHGFSRSRLGWLQPVVLLFLGLVMLLLPSVGAAAIGLILTVFFLLDGIAGIALAYATRPLPGWTWTLFSGLVSLAIAIVFIAGWPFQATWLVGLFVGISLLLDGLSLLILASPGP